MHQDRLKEFYAESSGLQNAVQEEDIFVHLIFKY